MKAKQDKHLLAIQDCEKKISSLPAGEIKYHLFILLHSIKEKNNEASQKLIVVLSELLDNLNDLHQLISFDLTLFNKIYENYNKLQTIAQINSYGYQFKIIVLHIGGAIAAVICGIAGGLVGGIVGLARGTWNHEPHKGLGIGLFTGYFVGAIVGFRTPKKLCKDEFQRQLEFGLNGFGRGLENLRQTLNHERENLKPFEDYFEEEKALIRNQCFASDSEFEAFLDEDITYEINSFKAGFIGGASLHGYLGHHLYIVIKIKESQHLIEFTRQPADTSIPPDQQEMRTVKGKKIIEMLATYKKLQETNACTYDYILTRMKPGDNDCHTLVNKVLIGTDQPAARLLRYQGMNTVGATIGFFISKLSPFKEEFFTTPGPSLEY
ncbi:hypothetical protein [Legionella maioricensis]|uniref:Transmembrane protein n=1 Tax=Legionella maioricensis TaxID=2896528 RepID=A0A9X2I905_9GAMM|nr:hypothetical protein [Legionella maioricensis]MCL9682491.1 hypothetical protein [Legionella maioricensis]MCL9686262.1 hypothetical protein [Legionella maioricensis]